MKNITLRLLRAVAFCAAFFSMSVPAVFADENWTEVFADGLWTAAGEKTPVSALKKKKFVGVYVSASWCGPCRQFTPKLIEFYEQYKDRMEIVLIGADASQEAVFKYARDHGMPWLVAAHKSAAGTGGYLNRNRVSGIPDFRLYDKNGKLLEADGRDLSAVRRAITGEKSTSAAGTSENWDSFFKDGLFRADGKSVPVSDVKKKKYVGVYVSSPTCGSCEAFTPKLAEFYKKNKTKIEIVLLCGGSQEDVLKYMKSGSPEAQRYAIKYGVAGTPNFQIFDRSGKLVLNNIKKKAELLDAAYKTVRK